MLRLCTKLLLCISALFAGAPVQAEIINLVAHLTRNQEPPATGGNQPTLTCPPASFPCTPPPAPFGGIDPRPVSFGTAVFLLDTAPGGSLTMTVTVFNIDVGGPGVSGGIGTPPTAIPAGLGTQTPNDANDDLVAAHIHVGTGVPGVSNSPVRWGFWGLPFNTDLDGQMLLHPGGVGGVFTGEWDSLEGNGTTVPGGSIPVTLLNQIPDILAGRAYINYHTGQFPGGEIRGQLLVVPEPATLALLSLGLLGIAGLRRKSA